MRAHEFEIEQAYALQRRRLINRGVLGWGVVYGFKMTVSRPQDEFGVAQTKQYNPKEKSPHDAKEPPSKHPAGTTEAPSESDVGGGFALDRHGREIVLSESATLGSGNTFILAADAAGCRTLSLDRLEAGRYVLSVHYAERRFGDAHLPGGCGCDDPQKNYVCETAVFSLTPLRDRHCPCGEEPCRHKCDCDTIDTCGYGTRGPHACICEWLISDDRDPCDAGKLCEWHGYFIDPADPVALACVTVRPTDDKCRPMVVVVEDACSPRRFVKNNDLLYDVLRGCDLTHISDISWRDWHRAPGAVPWTAFAAMFDSDGKTKFQVKFSGPVQVDTIRRDTVVITVVTVEQSTGWRLTRRVPLQEIDVKPSSAALPPGTTDQMSFVVRPRWIRDEIDAGGQSWLTDREFTVEIEIRGDLILDCHGLAIDGNAIGLRPAPSGNGTPGGTYTSCFHVDKKPADTDAA
jgi:hypothetical protein